MSQQGVSTLWIPSPDSFQRVDEIPVLGSGKVALKDAQEMAKQLIAA
jgi:acyl-[acyl-carrier-protein]-phospholipid O-acyltransferase/long-chain-fatty-acid--[acyl-carrier-protein] ligase